MQLVRIFSRLQLHKNRGEAWPFLNIEIWHFRLTFHAKNCFHSFESNKWNFINSGPSFWLLIENLLLDPHWKKSFRWPCKLYTFLYDGASNCFTLVVLRNLDGFEPWFAFDCSSFDYWNRLGGMQDVAFWRSSYVLLNKSNNRMQTISIECLFLTHTTKLDWVVLQRK